MSELDRARDGCRNFGIRDIEDWVDEDRGYEGSAERWRLADEFAVKNRKNLEKLFKTRCHFW